VELEQAGLAQVEPSQVALGPHHRRVGGQPGHEVGPGAAGLGPQGPAAALEDLGEGGALAGAGLAGPWDRYPDDFSGGQQQRIAIARATVGERSLLLADEPTGSLDTVNAELVVELLTELCVRRGTAVVLVTHEPRFAAFADRVVFLRDGRVADQTRATDRAAEDGAVVVRR